MSLFRVLIVLILILFAVPPSLHAGDWPEAERHSRRADQLIQQKRFDEALSELRQAEEAYPDGGHFATRQGWVVLWPMQDAAGSLPFFDRALTQGGEGNPWTLRDRGTALCRLKRYSEANRSLTASIEAAGAKGTDGHDELLNSLGWASVCRQEQGDYETALKLADRGYAERPNSDNWALAEGKIRSALWLGHRAMAEGRYDEAIRYYAMVESTRSLSEPHRQWLQDLNPPLLRKLAETRRDVEVKRIKPEYVHRIFVVFLRRSNLNFRSLKGETIHTEGEISDLERERALLFLQLLRSEVEAMSGGRFSLQFKIRDLNATLTELRSTSFGSIETRQPIFETISPEVGEVYCEAAKEYDTIWTYWQGEGAATTANGGSLTYPCVPYQLYSPVRGYVSYPVNWNGPDAIVGTVHEFFHDIEAMAGIQPTHGFEPRNRGTFPGWKGSGQLDYFQWHFANTLPAIQNDPALANGAPTYRNLNYLIRQPDRNTEDVIEANAKAVHSLGPSAQREAKELADLAVDLKWNRNDPANALAKAKEALTRNPSQRDALLVAALVSADRKDFASAVGYFQTLAPLNPEPWILKYLAYLQQWQTRDLAGALKTYEMIERLYRTSPEIAEIYPGYGRTLMDLGRLDEAIRVFEKGRHSHANDARPTIESQCAFWKGYLLGEKMNRRPEALALVQEAWEAGYRDPFVEFYVKKYRGGDVAQRALVPEPEQSGPDVRPPARTVVHEFFRPEKLPHLKYPEPSPP